MISLFPFIILALTGKVVATPLKPTPVSLSRRQSNPTADCPQPSDSSFVTAAHAEALTLANGAVTYLQDHDVTDDLFITYFGAAQDSTTQLSVFSDAANEHTLTLFCADPGDTCASPPFVESGFGAYGTDDSIVFCPSSYQQFSIQQLCTGLSIDTNGFAGATTLFVITQVLDEVGSDIIATKNCSDARNLASSNPGPAQDNAQNYICFAMQVFVDAQCVG